MNRIKIITIAAIVGFLLCGVALGDRPRDLVRQHRNYAIYDLSGVAQAERANEVVLFVDSTSAKARDGNDGIHGESWDVPYATVDYALDQMVAGGGTILVSPGHTEDVISAGDWLLDIVGVTIEGKGYGENKPTITITTATLASIQITAHDCVIRGLNIVCGIFEADHLIDVNDADDLWIDDCHFSEGLASGVIYDVNGFTYITADDSDGYGDGLTISNSTFSGFDSTSWTSAIELAVDLNDVTIANSKIFGAWEDSGIEIPAGGNAQVNMMIDGCQITNTETGDHAIQINGTASTGVISGCVLVTDGTYVDAGGLQIVNTQNAPYGTDSDVGVGDAANIAAILVDTGTTLPATLAILDAAAAASADHVNYLAVATGTFDTTGTWSTVAAHEIAVVTGHVRMQIWIEVLVGTETVSADGTIALGIAGNTAFILAATDVEGGAGALVTGDVVSAVFGGSITGLSGTEYHAAATHAVFDVFVPAGLDVGYTVGTNALDAGSLIFHIYWTPLDATGAVSAGAGGPF